MNKNSSYSFAADVIRVIAIFGTVSIHITNAVYTRLDFFGGTSWWVALLLNELSRIAIPLFILLSGYLLLDKNESFIDSLKRLCFRIIIPLFFWFLFYTWFDKGAPSFQFFTPAVFTKIFSGNMFHLYFLVIMAGLYFMAPIFRSFLQTAAQSQKRFMFWLLGIGSTLTALQYLLNACGSENFFTRWLPYAGIFVAGVVLKNKTKAYHKSTLLIIYLLSLGVTISFGYLHYFFLQRNIVFLDSPRCMAYYTDHYVSINVLLMAIAAFLLLLNSSYTYLRKNTFLEKLIPSLAKASFGIYLIHPLVARELEIQFHLAVDFNSLPLLVILFLRLILVCAISYGITLLLLKIPYLRMLIGTFRS